MSELYDRIEALCRGRDMNVTQMCREAGVPRGNLTDLKMGRQQGLSAKNLQKIAAFFGVSMSALMGGAAARTDPQAAELEEYLEALKNDPQQRMLFALTKDATVEELRATVAFLRTLRGK